MSLDLIKPVWVRHCPKRPQGLAQLCLHKLTIATRMKAARSTPTLGEEVGTWGRRQDMVVLTHAQLTDALRGRCTWHWYWKSTWTAFKYSPAWAHNFTAVWLHLFNREMNASPDHSKCFTRRWDRKRIEGRNNTRLRPFTRTAALGWEARWQQEVLQWILIVLKFKKDESNSQSFSWICALPFTLTFSRHDVCLQWRLS